MNARQRRHRRRARIQKIAKQQETWAAENPDPWMGQDWTEEELVVLEQGDVEPW